MLWNSKVSKISRRKYTELNSGFYDFDDISLLDGFQFQVHGTAFEDHSPKKETNVKFFQVSALMFMTAYAVPAAYEDRDLDMMKYGEDDYQGVAQYD